MSSPCPKIVIPTVDNTPVCKNPLADTCVIHEAAIAYLSLPVNSTQEEVTLALLASLVNARERIVILEEIVEDFETRITALE